MSSTLRSLSLSLLALLAPLSLLAADAPAAKPYAVGDAFVAFSTVDQHDKPFAYEGGARHLVIAFEMGAGKAANAYLEQQPADFLASRRTLFLANIHGMPGIARRFAMPKMRKYPHRILLADAEHFLDRYPRKDDHLTVLTLDESGHVTAIAFVGKKEAARAFAD